MASSARTDALTADDSRVWALSERRMQSSETTMASLAPPRAQRRLVGGEGRCIFIGVLVEDVFVGGHDNVLYEDWMWVGASRHPTNRLWALGGANDNGVLCED